MNKQKIEVCAIYSRTSQYAWHQFTIPVEWVYEYQGSKSESLAAKVVVKMACACGKQEYTSNLKDEGAK